MPLPNPDPGIGPSFTLCVGYTWREDFAGLLGEMLYNEYWQDRAAITGDTLTDEDLLALTDGAHRILNRICQPTDEEDGCEDLEPSGGGVPDFGTVYSKTYSFTGSSVPTGWTVSSGNPESAGLGDKDLNLGSVGWQRRISCTLALNNQCHPRIAQPTVILVASDIASNEFFQMQYRLSSASRLSIQALFPEVATWTPTLFAHQVYGEADNFQFVLQLDEQVSSASLTGSANLVNIYLEASSTDGNPFP